MMNSPLNLIDPNGLEVREGAPSPDGFKEINEPSFGGGGHTHLSGDEIYILDRTSVGGDELWALDGYVRYAKDTWDAWQKKINKQIEDAINQALQDANKNQEPLNTTLVFVDSEGNLLCKVNITAEKYDFGGDWISDASSVVESAVFGYAVNRSTAPITKLIWKYSKFSKIAVKRIGGVIGTYATGVYLYFNNMEKYNCQKHDNYTADGMRITINQERYFGDGIGYRNTHVRYYNSRSELYYQYGFGRSFFY